MSCCRDCGRRWVTMHGSCHAKCPDYKKERLLLEARKKAEPVTPLGERPEFNTKVLRSKKYRW